MKSIIVTFSVWPILVCMFLFLTGCTRKTPVETAFQDAHNSLTEIKQTLSSECQTVSVLGKIEKAEIKTQIAEQVCQAKIKDMQIKYERLLWACLFVFFVLLAKIFIKK